MLSSDQQQVAAYFATPERKPEPAGFATVATMARQTGAPIIDGCLSWFDSHRRGPTPPEATTRFSSAAWSRPAVALVSLWSTGPVGIALTAEVSPSDRLANASDGLAVAYHLLGVGPEEMLDAQSSVEPAMAALATRTSVGRVDLLEELVDQSERVVDQPDEFNQLALAFHNAVAQASRNRVLQATLASLGQVQSSLYRDRSPQSAPGSRGRADRGCCPCFVGVMPRGA